MLDANSDLASVLTWSKSLLRAVSPLCSSDRAPDDLMSMSFKSAMELLRSLTEPQTAGSSPPHAARHRLSTRDAPARALEVLRGRTVPLATAAVMSLALTSRPE